MPIVKWSSIVKLVKFEEAFAYSVVSLKRTLYNAILHQTLQSHMDKHEYNRFSNNLPSNYCRRKSSIRPMLDKFLLKYVITEKVV